MESGAFVRSFGFFVVLPWSKKTFVKFISFNECTHIFYLLCCCSDHHFLLVLLLLLLLLQKYNQIVLVDCVFASVCVDVPVRHARLNSNSNYTKLWKVCVCNANFHKSLIMLHDVCVCVYGGWKEAHSIGWFQSGNSTKTYTRTLMEFVNCIFYKYLYLPVENWLKIPKLQIVCLRSKKKLIRAKHQISNECEHVCDRKKFLDYNLNKNLCESVCGIAKAYHFVSVLWPLFFASGFGRGCHETKDRENVNYK